MSHMKTNKVMSAGMSADEKRWRAEEDIRTLQRAAEIQADKGRMKACKDCAANQVKALQKVTGGRSAGRKK